jgi:ABC-type phosphate/phosphonate transport system ATPase subunit
MRAPRLVLADEPVVRPRTSRDIMALLHEASREQGAAVLCSHDVLWR